MPIKIDIDQKSGWLLIVSDQIAHQDVENVIVDGNGLFEARHARRMKEEVRIMK